MNNMLTRAISGAVFVSILVFSILYSPYSFLGLFFICMLISIFEFSKMLQLKSTILYLIATTLFASSILEFWEVSAFYANAVSILMILFVFTNAVFNEKKDPIDSISKLLLCLAYACIPYIFISKIPFTNLHGTYQPNVIIGVFILIWSNDTFAYITGVTIGKHKLLERISPKKTIEGFVGGVAATLGISYLLAVQFDVLSTLQWILIAGIVSVFGVVGDLVASMFKRQTGVKDTGNIIPGHGGILDRLDSIIFAAPFIYLFLKLITEHVS